MTNLLIRVVSGNKYKLNFLKQSSREVKIKRKLTSIFIIWFLLNIYSLLEKIKKFYNDNILKLG